MNTIMFKGVLPQVFSTGQEQMVSDVWLSDVTFQRGHHYLVEAESGKGKSTFCSYILGYRHDYSGQLLFDDSDARSFSISDWSRLRQHHVSCLFQELRLFPELTAYENVEIKNHLTKHKTRQEIEMWFDMLGISDKLNAKVGRMSFGQQQRVALIRALAQPFDFLLADEPISHLDDRNAMLMADIVKAEADRQGASIIATSIGKRMPLPYEFTLQL
ncbi:MAG: ATP-binding cassette domain-containing protein [Prevotella sp.]|nr:ATP-binding cassette domain-containing protein [Prevotella sp.]